MEDDRKGLRREKLSEETLLRQKDKADRRRRSEIAIIYQFYSQVLIHPSVNIMRQKKFLDQYKNRTNLRSGAHKSIIM